VIVPGPTACPCCCGLWLAKLGEDVTETLEVIPRQWKVIQHVREKFSCRDCATIDRAPAPFHVVPRGWAGPSLLAMILFAKYGQHQPLNRQAERYAREGVPLSLSTLADQVGACCTVLRPLRERLLAHVLAAERLHGDDTTVPVLAKGKTVTARCWTYVRDDQPFGGRAPPAALFFYSRDRSGEHPRQHLASWSGILQADACGGYGKLYEAERAPAPVLEASCWAHARRKFFELADIEAAARRKAQRRTPPVISPMALEAVQRIDALFDIERTINGLPAEQRLAVRQQKSAPLVDALEAWMREERRKLSRHSDVAGAIDYMLKRWASFTRFLEDGRICLTNNAAERALRGLALGRKVWLFAGSDRGGQRTSPQPDRHRQTQRRRSSGLARRRAGPHRGASGQPARPTAAVELAATSATTRCCLTASPLSPRDAHLRGLHRMRTLGRQCHGEGRQRLGITRQGGLQQRHGRCPRSTEAV
jgi:transposase